MVDWKEGAHRRRTARPHGFFGPIILLRLSAFLWKFRQSLKAIFIKHK